MKKYRFKIIVKANQRPKKRIRNHPAMVIKIAKINRHLDHHRQNLLQDLNHNQKIDRDKRREETVQAQAPVLTQDQDLTLKTKREETNQIPVLDLIPDQDQDPIPPNLPLLLHPRRTKKFLIILRILFKDRFT